MQLCPGLRALRRSQAYAPGLPLHKPGRSAPTVGVDGDRTDEVKPELPRFRTHLPRLVLDSC